MLRNDLINYLTGNTQNRIIALKPKHSNHQNKGNLLANLTHMLNPDISTKHKDMTFLLSYYSLESLPVFSLQLAADFSTFLQGE